MNKNEKKALARYEHVDLDMKEPYIKTMIVQHCSAAFAIGAIPLSCADAPFLVTNELAILSRIFIFYGFSNPDEIFKVIGIDAIIERILTILGKSIANGLIKAFEPTKIIASAISAGTASAVTLAFAMSVSKTVKLTCKANAKQIENIKFLNNQEEITAAVVGTAVQCLEDGKTNESDYDNFEITTEQLMTNIKKGNELFQKFLDQNTELDNQFVSQQSDSDKLSSDMWDAINKI